MANSTSANIGRTYYDRSYYAGHNKRLSDNDKFTAVKIQRMLSLLRPKTGEIVLDLGSGVGTIMIALAKRGIKTVGLDYSWKSLMYAHENFGKAIGHDVFRGLCCDGRSMALAFESLDAIVAIDFTEHLDDAFLTLTLSEAHRILKKGGRLAIYTPNVTHLFERLKKDNIILKKDVSHIGLRTMPRYVEMLEHAGFSVSESYYEPTHIPVFGMVEKFLMHVPGIGPLFRRRICISAVK
jgi:cyclopropane fatty-acyl-phospholipid synthase-like methyltransferase